MSYEAIIRCGECPPEYECGAELGPFDTPAEATAVAEEWMEGYSMFYLSTVRKAKR